MSFLDKLFLQLTNLFFHNRNSDSTIYTTHVHISTATVM